MGKTFVINAANLMKKYGPLLLNILDQVNIAVALWREFKTRSTASTA